MTEPRKKQEETLPERFVLEDVTGLKIDRSQEEGDEIDFGSGSDADDDSEEAA